MKLKKLLVPFMAVLFIFSGISQGANEETPPFKEILKDGKFQVREYPPLMVAMASSQYQNGLFRTVANYIFGGNDRNEQIPMTSPVFSFVESREMTMMFYMPSYFKKLSDLPRPNSSEVSLGWFDPGKVAVVQYSGYSTEEKRRKNYRQLVNWGKRNGLNLNVSETFWAGYDSPWVPGPQRTNEVLIPIQ